MRKITGKKGVDVVFEHVGARDLQRLAAVPQARRAAGHLRLDLGAVDDHQPDAAVPAAVPHHRLVRRLDAQHPREPRQDGGRPAAGDRHRGRRSPTSSAGWRGSKAGRCSARSSSRSDEPPRAHDRPRRRSPIGCAHASRRRRRRARIAGGRHAARDPRDQPQAHGRLRRPLHAHASVRGSRSTGSAAPISPPRFPEKSADEIEAILRGVWDNLGRVAAEFAHIDRLRDARSRPARSRATSLYTTRRYDRVSAAAATTASRR